MQTQLVVTIDGRTAVTGSRQVNRAVDTVRRNARGMTREVDGSFKRLQKSLFSMRNAIAGLGIAMFVRKALGSFGDFETGLVGVGKTTGIAGDQLKKLGKDVIQMSLRLPIARDELLDIAQAAGQLGISGSDNILKFTEVIAKLGKASDLAGSEAALTLARILGITGEATDSVDRLASSLVFLGNNAKASEAEIAKMVIELAKGTAQFKVSSANLAGLGTTLKEFGQQAELSRSTILKTFLMLKSVTGEGGDNLKRLAIIAGQTGEQFKKTFEKDTFGAFLLFIKGLRSVIEQGGNAEKVLGDLGLRGTEVNAILPLLAINFDKLSQRVNQSNKAYRENTALNEEAAQAFSTFQSAMQLVGNNLTEIFRIIGDKLAPSLVTLGEKITDIAKSDELKIFATALGAAFSFLADNIDIVVFALSTLALTKFIGLFVSLASKVKAAAVAMRLGASAAIAQSAGLAKMSSAANLGIAGYKGIAISAGKVSRTTKIAAVATRGLAAGFALLGGPVGVIALLITVLYSFREELGLVTKAEDTHNGILARAKELTEDIAKAEGLRAKELRATRMELVATSKAELQSELAREERLRNQATRRFDKAEGSSRRFDFDDTNLIAKQSRQNMLVFAKEAKFRIARIKEIKEQLKELNLAGKGVFKGDEVFGPPVAPTTPPIVGGTGGVDLSSLDNITADKIKGPFTEAERLTEEFSNKFEDTFKDGLGSVFRNGKDGWKDMLGGFRNLYFDLVTELAAKPILDFLLGKKTTAFGGRTGDGPVGGFFNGLFKGGTEGKAKAASPDFIGPPLPEGFGQENGTDFASSFVSESEGSGGFLGKLTGIFGNSGSGGGFLDSMGTIFSGLTSNLSGVFSNLGGMLSGGLIGGASSGIGSLIGLAGSLFGGFFADGGSVGGKTPIVVGERGPELFVPPVDGEIISNDMLKKFGNNIIPLSVSNMARTANDNNLPDNFGGFFANGGSVKSGQTIVAGEKGKELFVPTLANSSNASNNDGNTGDTVVVNINVSSPDVVTFRRSQGQIAAEAAQAITRAKRNL